MSPLLPAGAGSSQSGAGTPGAAPIETVRFPVSGMTCGSCAVHIVRALRGRPGVSAVKVDLRRETVTVRRDPALARDADIAAAIEGAGYEPDLGGAEVISENRTSFLARWIRR